MVPLHLGSICAFPPSIKKNIQKYNRKKSANRRTRPILSARGSASEEQRGRGCLRRCGRSRRGCGCGRRPSRTASPARRPRWGSSPSGWSAAPRPGLVGWGSVPNDGPNGEEGTAVPNGPMGRDADHVSRGDAANSHSPTPRLR